MIRKPWSNQPKRNFSTLKYGTDCVNYLMSLRCGQENVFTYKHMLSVNTAAQDPCWNLICMTSFLKVVYQLKKKKAMATIITGLVQIKSTHFKSIKKNKMCFLMIGFSLSLWNQETVLLRKSLNRDLWTPPVFQSKTRKVTLSLPSL